MAVELTLTGNTFDGRVELTTYSSVEDATPVDPALNSGGIGQLSFTVGTEGGSDPLELLYGHDVVIADGNNGVTTGRVNSLSGTTTATSVTADSRLFPLLSELVAEPRNDTIENIYRYYLGLAGITTGIVFEAPSAGKAYTYAANSIIPVPGWTGVAWDYLRQFAVAMHAEVSLVSNNVVFRPLRLRTGVDATDSERGWSVEKSDAARNIEISYYSTFYAQDQLIYPEGGWKPDVSVFQVEAGETEEFNIPLDFFPQSITQPVCVDYVGSKDTGSVYAVLGNDGLALKARQWIDNGGSLTVSIGEDRKSLDVKVVGANTSYGPFKIAAGASASDVYSSLRIRGSGVGFKENVLTLPTGADPALVPQEVGVSVQNMFVRTLSEAYTLGMRTAGRYAGVAQTISATALSANRKDVSGSARYPTFDEFNDGVYGAATSWVGKTFNDFNTEWAGKTLNNFNTYYVDIVRSDFANQAFGNVSGARVRRKDAFYRIDSATVTEGQISYSASMDTTFDDFAAAWSLTPFEKGDNTQFTFSMFNAMMEGKTFQDLALQPLWRERNM